MDTKICSMCNIEIDINNLYKKYSECINCNRTRGLKRYYENKDKISNQQRYIMKRIEKKYYYRNKTTEVFNLVT